MGLREIKAARSRQQMSDVALELFLQDGYDQTTMEQIAERAEVGTTTLYRYFPTKDQLLLDPLMDAVDLTPFLSERPADEPLDVALAGAIIALAATLDEADARITQIRRLIDASPSSRAKLWDRYRSVREALEAAIARRAGKDPDDLSVRATAGVMLDIVQMADQTHLREGGARTHIEIVTELLDLFPRAEVVMPRMPPTAGEPRQDQLDARRTNI